jgi:hypothetical protein
MITSASGRIKSARRLQYESSESLDSGFGQAGTISCGKASFCGANTLSSAASPENKISGMISCAAKTDSLLGERWRSRSRRQKTMIQIRGRPATCVHRFVRPSSVGARAYKQYRLATRPDQKREIPEYRIKRMTLL